MADVATALAQAAKTMDDTARYHKREEAAHRRAARDARRKFDEFRAALVELGIEVHLDTGPGGHSHERTDT